MIINIENSIYPEKLKKLKNPPQILYTMGNIELLRTNRNINNRIKKTNKIWRKNGKNVCKRFKFIWINNC